MNIRFILFLIVLSASQYSHATKPCFISKCLGNDGKIDLELCHSNADWVAEGVVHVESARDSGYPLNTTFYTFTFVPENIYKGDISNDMLVFKTGWCSNRWAEDMSSGQRIRIYGLNVKDSVTQQNSFLHYEVIPSR